jgi:phosphomannomutase
MTDEDLIAAAQAWHEADPDAKTQAEVRRLTEASDLAALRERFSPLTFGTAGLRGLVGAGPGRMNRAVVLRATHGLAAWLEREVRDARSLPVVVGHDARLDSARFAADVCAVLREAGFSVRRFESAAPTPLVAFVAKELGAAAAVVVTASHNPPEYNGFKVFGPDALQITSPVDAAIAARIAEAPPARRLAATRREPNDDELVPASLTERYLDGIGALRSRRGRAEPLRIAYTALHGVGGALAERALSAAGHEIHAVPEQHEPDGRFPTVSFPNPEEPGALDRALALAKAEQADLLLANDPDADRLAAAAPTASGSFRVLTGNQIGLLLAEHLLSAGEPHPRRLVVSSLVSSPMLGVIAAAHGARWERTLTGFKWIWSAALELEHEAGARFVFGYEEALGYSVGGLVRDKDGLSAAVLLADVAAEAKARGESLLDVLAALYRRHGLWVSAQRVVAGEPSALAVRLARLSRALPTELAGEAIARVTDYSLGASERPRWLPAQTLLEVTFGDDSRLLARVSGTEPKLKLYLDVRGALADGAALGDAEAAAMARADALGAAFLERFAAQSAS